MIKIIDGFRHDTSKAIAIGSAESKCMLNEMHWWAETLYKTPRAGKYFFCIKWHVLGALKEGIKPVSMEVARKWCQLYLQGEEWKRYFPNNQE